MKNSVQDTKLVKKAETDGEGEVLILNTTCVYCVPCSWNGNSTWNTTHSTTPKSFLEDYQHINGSKGTLIIIITQHIIVLKVSELSGAVL